MITLIGLGAGDVQTLSRAAEAALRTASAQREAHTGLLLLRTARHPCVPTLREWSLGFDTCDDLYDTLPAFAAVYEAIARRVLEAAQTTAANGQPLDVAFAVPGHPLFAEESVRLIREQAQQAGLTVEIVSSGSFVEAALTAAGASLDEGCDVRDALTLPLADAVDRAGSPTGERPDASRSLLLYQVYDAAAASHAKLALMRAYPDDWNVQIVQAAGVKNEESVRTVPLFRLDREPVDHLTSVYVPPLPPALRRPGFAALVGIMARLRAPDGCPWDREQTHATLKKYFIEETYEALEAIDEANPGLLCEELGDVLLQVVFHAQLATEEGVFTIDDVCGGIVEKLVRRHPHVFGDVDVVDSNEVLRNWERIKREEKTELEANWRPSVLDGVPKGLPALMQAMELSKRAVKVGFEWETFADVAAKWDEESRELRVELDAPTPDKARIASELGDLLFTLVQIARWQKIDPEEALRAMLLRFSGRFRHMETRAGAGGRALADLNAAELDALWNQAKAAQG